LRGTGFACSWAARKLLILENPGLTARRPTILQIVPRLDSGGAEITTLEVAQAIVEAGGRALVLSEGGRLAQKIADVGGEIVPFRAATKNPLGIISNGRELARLIRAEHADLVHARSRAPAWSALMAARTAGVPFVTTYHGAYKEVGRIKSLYNGVMARADIVIANSRYTADLIRSRYGKPAEEITVIYRGVDAERFAPEHIPRERVDALRRRWGVPSSHRIVLHAARLSPLKGQAVVVAAARILKDRGALDGVSFVLAGSDQGRTGYTQSIQARIREAALDDHVHLVGHLDDMPAGLRAATLALMVSVEPEGFGRVAAEAQAMGCPVIVTDVGALPECVRVAPLVPEDTITGWLVPPNDPNRLADAIDRALSLSDAGRTAMAERARQFALENYSTRRLQTDTLAVYDRLLGTSLASRFARNVM
jgi:glycosyltransferase involved in cell wall biosynthesis